MNDRIKLAEAMGWQKIYGTSLDPCMHWRSPDDIAWEDETALPDPFTDANDDYAVLEWMREHDMAHSLAWLNANNYQLGDYARAALKVME